MNKQLDDDDMRPRSKERFSIFNNNDSGDHMISKLKKFIRDQRGLTTVEYAVAGALVTAAVVAAFTLLGGNVAAMINYLAGQIVVP